MVSRFNLPDIDFLSIDAEELESTMVSAFESLLTGVSLNDSDPRRKLLQAVTLILTLAANNINFTGKQNLLAYAVDNYLDHLGISKNVLRLEAKAASTTIRFIINTLENFTIPQGTRLTVDNLEFEISGDYYVTAGTTQVDITANCTEAGTIGNGYLPNQITSIVDNDQLPWVVSASNITTSAGGVDIEEDDEYAERIRASNESFSVAGPELAYVYFAKSANQKIIDIQVLSNSPGVIEIVPLMENGELPTEEEQSEILAICSDKKVRPLTDQVLISLPEQIPYDVTITYYLPQESVGLQDSVIAAVDAAVQEYIVWQKSKLGRGIDPSELYARLQNAGAKRISVQPNEYVPLAINQIAQERDIVVNFGGIIND